MNMSNLARVINKHRTGSYINDENDSTAGMFGGLVQVE